MGFEKIGYPGANQITPRVNFQQPGVGSQLISRQFTALPICLNGGEVFVLPPGNWLVQAGRYTDLQMFDPWAQRWRNYSTQPGEMTAVPSDGANFRLANTTGCPVGAIINNVGNGNYANGYNTVTVTPSAGNSTWGTLVGGSVNTTVTVTTGGNFTQNPIIVWTPAANQTLPFIEPTFYANINNNGTINTVTVQYGGAGLAAPGTITAIQQITDTGTGGAVLTLGANLTNSGNLIAMWPITLGNTQTSTPTLTFGTGTANANVIMNYTVTGVAVGQAGANLGVSMPILVLSANGVTAVTAQNAAITGNDLGTSINYPRMAWLLSNSQSNATGNTTTVTIQDAGFHLQAVPSLVAIAQNANSSTNTPVVYTATVGSIVDTSFGQVV